MKSLGWLLLLAPLAWLFLRKRPALAAQLGLEKVVGDLGTKSATGDAGDNVSPTVPASTSYVFNGQVGSNFVDNSTQATAGSGATQTTNAGTGNSSGGTVPVDPSAGKIPPDAVHGFNGASPIVGNIYRSSDGSYWTFLGWESSYYRTGPKWSFVRAS